MAIGVLRLLEDYISKRLPKANQQWLDEPENSYVAFQYDPSEVKFTMKTKWKKGSEDNNASDDYNIEWVYGDDTEPTELEVNLIFNDLFPVENTLSRRYGNLQGPLTPAPTQRSLEILEAMALPIRAPVLIPVKLRYRRQIILEKRRVEYDEDLGYAYDRQKPDDTNSHFSWQAWRQLQTTRYARTAWFTEKVERSGEKLKDDYWHMPRPLGLTLADRDGAGFLCQIKTLETAISGLNEDGSPSSASAKVVFIPYTSKTLPGDALVQATPEILEDAGSISKWNELIESGKMVRQTIPPKRELTDEGIQLSRERPPGGQRIIVFEGTKKATK